MNDQNATQDNETSPDQTETPQHLTQTVREVIHDKYEEDMRARTAEDRRARSTQLLTVVAGTLASALLVLAARSKGSVKGSFGGLSRTPRATGSAKHALDAFEADFEAQLARQQQALDELDGRVDQLFARRRERRGSGRTLLLLVVGALLASRWSAGRRAPS